MTGVGAVLASASARLGSPAEARTLLAHAAGVEPSRLILLGAVEPSVEADFARLVERRAAGEPLQYLTGVAWFRTISVQVAPGVFIPRPETEVMVGWALEQLAGRGPQPIVVELCAGSGAISAAIAAEHPGCRQYAVELSEDAYRMAQTNLAGTEVDLRLGDMADAFPELDGQVDLVIANPPYIPLQMWEHVAAEVRAHEPEIALFSGLDGLDALRVVAKVAGRLLRPGGAVCAEHAEVQGQAVQEVFVEAGSFVRVGDHRDLNDRPRFVTAIRAGNLAG
ncbi:release factor glutamine methyltransferase [Propionicimonas paludicola]|uniref:Release factor glutamine methyltransferase n=1 Tax=Propionicimonas paludicola TaxID=185243 RepID=A0A2A9CT52_9ACTN|nr:peptide chain release factor N(5)-glutamine methyltransferase [Propionicimonas paludicola]PFG16820.1 release factor glutamine methyltransferase [Propionicimonas paludicola]